MGADPRTDVGRPGLEAGRPELIAKIRERIRERGGRIPFVEFMAMALYEPGLGYYATRGDRERIGFAGADYYTSPTVHPVFGEMLAKQLREMAEMLGLETFTVVEQGAGSGLLAREILAAWGRHAAEHRDERAIRYVIIEPHATLAARQREALKDQAAVLWLDSLNAFARLEPGGVTGCLFSNELVDAFPVHRVVVRESASGGRLQEVFVTDRDGVLTEAVDEPSTPELAAYFSRLNLRLPQDYKDGYQTEVNLEALRWMRAVGRTIRRGFVLTIDYGYPAEERYAPHRNRGTFLCYHRHTVSEDPYTTVGEQDMTSHVDFTSLAWAGREAGLEVTGFTDQTSFLLGLGLARAIEARQAANAPADEVAKMTALLDPRDLGRTYKVLIQHRGIPSPRLSGLTFRAFLPLALP